MRAAIVGLGTWGQRLVFSVHRNSSAIEIVKGVTRTISKADDFAQATGIPITANLDEVLCDPSIDAVLLATPHSQHVSHVIQAATAGKHVFVEKPLALTVAGVNDAFEACERSGVTLAVGQNRRFLPSVQKIRALIEGGELGQILHIEGNYSGPSGWRHAASPWRASSAESPWGGMTGKGLHISDLMIDFAGPIAKVDARSDRQILSADLDDTTVMLLRFASGAHGYLASMTATADTWRMQIFGAKGWVEMRGLDTLIVAKNNELEKREVFGPIDIERAELEAFARSVKTGESYPVRRSQVANNIGLLEAIGRSIEARGEVAI